MPTVGLLGAFSIGNAGDALLGLAGRQALERLLPDARVELFAPRFAGPSWAHDFEGTRLGFPIHPVEPGAPLDWASDLDALIVGGGGILNFAPAFRAFLLGGADPWTGPPAAWNAVCSQGAAWYAVSDSDRALVARCAAALRHVSVRGAHTLKLLRGCGYDGPAAIVPDPAFGFRDDGAGGRADELLGLEPGRFLIAVTVGNGLADRRAAGYYAALAATITTLARERDARVVLLPHGTVYGDVALSQAFAARVPGARVAELGPLALWRVIGRAGLYAGARLHGVIAALAQRTPLLVIDEYFSDHTATSKLRELVWDHDLEAAYTSPFITRDPAPKIALALARPSRFDPAAVAAAVDENWRVMLRTLGFNPR